MYSFQHFHVIEGVTPFICLSTYRSFQVEEGEDAGKEKPFYDVCKNVNEKK